MSNEINTSEVPLQRESFLLDLLRELTGTLENVVGIDEAEGYVSLVGQKIGSQIDQSYKNAINVTNLSRKQVSEVLVDLKRRINGDFYIVEETDDYIILGNRACPFGDRVKDRPSLCMMTSNVFGYIASENMKYAKVQLRETIASGDAECRVVVYFKPNEEEGREYYKRSQ
ncbi:methanogen output domain 1-containing protein [Sneathiella glossodoripedis]|uniref:methanogen output domain 1-containing protein n=1 Tax=Sneathiella glossodoripedis TaxID=418853 RepID=UPI00046F50B8|nr:methanogen output domain 1-containing protein [Sneathiella glossodoripedis]